MPDHTFEQIDHFIGMLKASLSETDLELHAARKYRKKSENGG